MIVTLSVLRVEVSNRSVCPGSNGLITIAVQGHA